MNTDMIMKNTFIMHGYKILSMVLAIAMIFSMLPATAFAEAEPKMKKDSNSYYFQCIENAQWQKTKN